MIEAEEFSIITRDGTQLFGLEYLVAQPKATICLVHGLGEHVGRYEHVAKFFNQEGYSFLAFNQRGHGNSEGKRGHTPSHERLMDDVEEFLMYTRSIYNDLPMFLYGHSLGGNIVANYLLLKNTNELKGAVISSPWLKLEIQPTNIELFLAKWMVKIWPSFIQNNKIDSDVLTHDDEVNKKYTEDPLVFGQISVRMFNECYSQGLWALENADRLKLPTLAFHGDSDSITSKQGTQQFAEQRPDLVTFHLLQGTKHEPHNDVQKDEVLKMVSSWVESRLD
ncbi:MAG: lysophospholipase [Reichenbachiella sp.]